MNQQSKKTARAWILGIGIILPTMIVIGCATNQSVEDSEVINAEQLALLPEDTMRGAQLWKDNCIRCHNFRPPRSFSDNQWSVIMMHMRVRAHLTGGESRQILKFLQAAN